LLEARISEAGYSESFKISSVAFELEPGEILLVTGRSGSGKSTLLKALTGLIRVSGGFVDGSVKLGGVELLDKPLTEVFSRVFYIPQEPWYAVVGYTVASEYCYTLSVYGVKCRVEDLAGYGLLILSNRVTYGLSAGEYQRLLWSEVFAVNAQLVLMDEPFTYIDLSGRSTLAGFIEKLLRSGSSLVVVDHIPGNWRSYEPKTLVLDKGRVVYYGRYEQSFEEAVSANRVRFRRASGDPVLRADSVWFKYPGSKPLLKGVELAVERSSVVGLRGRNGVGKTTLLKVLAGILKPQKGFVERYGRVAYIPENPLLYFTHPTPREEIYSFAASAEVAERVVEELGLEDLLDKPLAVLSSGERRRVALASAIASGYDILLLDEPTGGLDKYSVEAFLDVLEFAVKMGATAVIAHHDPRLIGVFTHEYLLEDGVLKCLY